MLTSAEYIRTNVTPDVSRSAFVSLGFFGTVAVLTAGGGGLIPVTVLAIIARRVAARTKYECVFATARFRNAISTLDRKLV